MKEKTANLGKKLIQHGNGDTRLETVDAEWCIDYVNSMKGLPTRPRDLRRSVFALNRITYCSYTQFWYTQITHLNVYVLYKLGKTTMGLVTYCYTA